MSGEGVKRRAVNPALLLKNAARSDDDVEAVAETREFISSSEVAAKGVPVGGVRRSRNDWRSSPAAKLVGRSEAPVRRQEEIGDADEVVAPKAARKPSEGAGVPGKNVSRETLKPNVIGNPLLSSEASDVVVPDIEPVSQAAPEIEAPRRRVVNPRFADADAAVVPKAKLPKVPTSGVNLDSASGVTGRGSVLRPSRTVRPGFLTPADRDEHKPFTVKADAKPRHPYSVRASSDIEVEEWSEDKSSDTARGLGGEGGDEGEVKPDYSKGFHLTERDLVMMKFLARYRYANTDQLARLVDSTPRSVVSRMRILEARGFVRKQAITERQYLWMTRKAGNLIVGVNFGEIKKGTVSYATIAHTIGLANLGVELERAAGGKDILGERADPDDSAFENRWKLGIWNNPEGKTLGEMTVTEREIRQGQLRWRGGRSTAEMRELVEFAVSDDEEQPELLEGNEGLFVVYGQAGKDGEHIPDLVVARERAEDNSPQHLAIELELTGKPIQQWKRILRWYRDNGVMYPKVYYFTHKRSIASALRKADEEVGLGERLVIRKYIPINGRMPFWG